MEYHVSLARHLPETRHTAVMGAGMGDLSYLSIIERFHEHRGVIRELLASIAAGVSDAPLLDDEDALARAYAMLRNLYPFVERLYALDAQGRRINVGARGGGRLAVRSDCSQRPFYLQARTDGGLVVTEPYVSSASRGLCLSAGIAIQVDGELRGYIVFDAGLGRIVEFLMGDTLRRRFQGSFRMIYSLIVAGLMAVVGVLLFSSGQEFYALFRGGLGTDLHLRPFGIIIFLTLGLAVFDLAKTILEEEVLMHKDVYRHSATRRTITRFMSAILIAVSIEALLLLFKAALGEGGEFVSAVWMLLAAVALLAGLGVYVYLGARAEAVLLGAQRRRAG
ncbi:MAG: PDC sensor domain-containing protein [Acidihalobacter sp.]